MSKSSTDSLRIAEALEIAIENQFCDSVEGKQWIIDQMVRAMLGKAEYSKFIRENNKACSWPWETGKKP